MEKMKLRGEDRKVSASVGTRPACLLGQTPAQGSMGKKGEQKGREGWGRLEPPQGDPGPKNRTQYPSPSQLSGTYQVVTQTRWMSPDAKRANRGQRRTGEARGDTEGGGQNGHSRRSYEKNRSNLGPSESWGTCLEGYRTTTAGGPPRALMMPRKPALPCPGFPPVERKKKGDSSLKSKACL